MAYDEAPADRIREIIGSWPGMTERRMFGGPAWMVKGDMAVVARGERGLMVRVPPAEHDEMLTEPGETTTIMRGWPVRGWITVNSRTCAISPHLAAWVRQGLSYAHTLPAK